MDRSRLELEMYSSGFFSHGHHKRVTRGRFKEDRRLAGVICWVDNAPEVKEHVHKVFELQTIIREQKKLSW